MAMSLDRSALTRITAFILVLSCLIHHDIVDASLRDAINLRAERQANASGKVGSLDINPNDFLPTRKGLQRSGAASPPEPAEGGASPPEPPSGEAAGGGDASAAQMQQLLSLLLPLLSPSAAGGGGGAEPPMEMG